MDDKKVRDEPKLVISERADTSIREIVWDELIRKEEGATGPRPVKRKDD